MRSEKGSALITIILVVLVLTMVGIAGVLYMTMEDKLSGNDKITQAALYAAENGLRVGEKVIYDAALTNSSAVINTLLNPTAPPCPNLSPPGGGYAAVPLVIGTTTYYQVSIPLPPGVPGIAQYSIYVRNNEDDPAPGSATVDNDKKINMVVVSTVTAPSGRGITKILEEQMFTGGAGGMGGLQKGVNAGGTGAQGVK